MCASCGGNHWWGHGNGHAGGSVFRCDNPKCKKPVPHISAEEAQARADKCPHCLGEKMWRESPGSFESKTAAYREAAEILDEECTVNDAWVLGM